MFQNSSIVSTELSSHYLRVDVNIKELANIQQNILEIQVVSAHICSAHCMFDEI